MDCSLPGSPVHEISQARVLEWVAIAFPHLSLILSKFRFITEMIQKTKIMAIGPITPQQIDGETMETVADFIVVGCEKKGTLLHC